MAKKRNELVPVVFRMDPPSEGGACFALFPSLPGTNDPSTCACYQHVGQHGSADYAGCVRASRPAKPEEYAALLRELESAPYQYNAVVRQRESAVDRAARLEAIRPHLPRI